MRNYRVTVSSAAGRFVTSVTADTSVEAMRAVWRAFGAPFHTMVVRRVMS